MSEVGDYCPKDKSDWREWLTINHAKKEGVWLIFNKKNSSHYNLSWSESVDVALCFGWIDSTKRPIDDKRYKQYFTKRKAKSNWSKINKDKVKNLIEQNLMEEAGLHSIEIAKENGSWSFLDEVEALVIPKDLEDAFAEQQGTIDFYNSLSKSVKKGILYWVISAKRPETRHKRIMEVVDNASRGSIPKQIR